ncbi:MAG: hypothetical protein KJ614_03810 [Gammaproteobacteria bacterium]|uniref:hypothetical protein n=1 Tax=Rhodoferax sp. TaxID=50421 RepID=UPI001DDCAB67|nr:hypothetical protein [Rhodoferax sp.]MBU3898044.1 hypothetical protein [Gammaproteobacteria bacterium]MBU3999199.1 hypothetical protein [Gammaproteobacteria bacterium]MBU4081762.1 hypothetical protein [Gammaproteobacteria bacterium]MBU4112745.1 hypothetical protein [Gammaproteobacteria bacterium]MBU4172887.1 hypothetical protein [Gammaproteobacteria bacterium]
MSVINKMLRDLDSRQTGGPAPNSDPAQGVDPRSALTRHTLSVQRTEPPGRQAFSFARTLQLVTMVLTVLGVAAWLYLNQSAAPQPAAAPTGQVAISKTPPVAPAAPSAAPQATSSVMGASPPASPTRTASPTVLAKPAVVPRPVPATLPAAVAVPAPMPAATHLDFSLKMDNFLQHTPSPTAPARPPAAVTARAGAAPALAPAAPNVPAPAPAAVTQATPSAASAASTASTASTTQQAPARAPAAQEALAQAQQLWNAGSRSAAIDLLHQALTLAERASQAGAPSGSASVVAALARELARMELAEGRVSQALAMLTRLEPVLSSVADIWAIRGNAAQRLGQHAASASAYLMALKFRPSEPRWMLGAAVSLAAQGQTAAAAELAEKARDGGALTPEVANYLRQLGVPLRER